MATFTTEPVETGFLFFIPDRSVGTPTSTLQATFLSEDGVVFEVYAYRVLSPAEIEREVTLFRTSYPRVFKRRTRYRVITDIGK